MGGLLRRYANRYLTLFALLRQKFLLHIKLILIASHLISVAQAGQESSAKNYSTIQFIVLGDWGRHGEEGQRRVARQMLELANSYEIDFIITTGDNFYNNGVESIDDSHWQESFEQIYLQPGLENLKWYPSLGNHDYRGDIKAQITYADKHSNWVLPANYYARTFKPEGKTSVQFLFLDTNVLLQQYRDRPDVYYRINESTPAKQLSWAYNTLRKSNARWKIVIGHHPIRSAGSHGDSSELNKALGNLLKQQKVSAYFAGHDHHLEHANTAGKLQLFISGGGSRFRSVKSGADSKFVAASLGFSHVQLGEKCMTVRFINGQGQELYQSTHSVEDGSACR